MKKRDGSRGMKILSLVLLSVFMFSIVFQLVSAITATEVLNKIFGVTLTGKAVWEAGFTKMLVAGMIFLIVWAISDAIPFLSGATKSKSAIRIILSILIAYVSVIYIAPAELYAALVGYGAMAVTLTAILPFLIILTVAYSMSATPSPGKILFQKLILWVYLFYLGTRVVILMTQTTPGDADKVWPFALFIYGPMFIITLLFIIFDRTITHLFLTTRVQGYIEQSKVGNKAEVVARIALLGERITAATSSGQNGVVQQLKAAKESLEKLAREM